MSTKEFNVGVILRANAQQYTAEFQAAGQTYRTWTTQVQSGGATASSALQSTATQAQAMGTAMRQAGQQGAEGLKSAAKATQEVQTAGQAMLAALRDQVAVTGKSTDELLRYRAAQAGVAAEAAPLILQLQNQRAAHTAAAEAARTEEAAQRAMAAAKQQATTAQDNFLAGLREQAALQGKSSTEVLRYRAAQMGVSEGAEQYIRTLEAGAKAHMNGAISAGQHAAAMRMLPAQMTDVVTSVASGMPIWMVAIQQGGQIKDSFGGAGNALRAMASAVTPTVAGLTLLVGIAGLAATAYYQGSTEADRYREAIIMTGNAAGTTVNELTGMARAIAELGGTQGAASQALSTLAGTGAVASENLQQFAAVAMELERRSVQPIKTTAQHLEELGKAPLQASLKLNEQYHYLTESVYRQIKALQDQGKQEEAASLAQRTYAGTMAERVGEIRANLGTLERAWDGLGNGAKRAWDAMLNVGRAASLSDVREKIEETNRQLNALTLGDGFESTGGGAATGAGSRGRLAQIERLKKQLGELQAQAAPLEAEDLNARIKAEKQATDAIELAARQRVDGLAKAVRSQAEIRKQEIEQLNRDRETLKLSQAEYDALLKGINEKHKDKSASSAGKITVSDSELANLQGQLQAAKLYHEQLVTLGAGASELNAGEKESLKIGEQLLRNTDAKTAARLREKQAIADALGVQLRSNDGLEKSFKAHQAMIDAVGKDADAITQRAQQQEAANATLGKSKTAIEQLTLAELQKQMAEAQGSDSFDPKYIASLELKIAAQRRFVDALGQADYKAAQQHVNELLRGAQELSKAYADEQALSGLTALEREKIVAQRQVELKYAKELAAIDAMALSDTEKQALREVALTAKRKESAAAVAKAEQQYQARAAEEINRSLTDALMRGFENGKGFAENMADATVNMFKTMVLRPTISAIMTPVSMVVNGVIQQGLNAVGLGSGGSILNLASSAGSLYSAGTAAAGWLGIGSSASAGAYALGTGATGLGLTTGGGLGLTAGGGLGLTAGSGAAASAGAAAGASAGGFSSMLSAIPGWGWALAGVALLAGSGLFKDNAGTPHWGAASEYQDGVVTGGEALFRTSGTAGTYSKNSQANVDAVAKGIGDALNGIATAFGGKGGYGVMTAYSDDDSEDPGFGSLRISRNGQSLRDWEDERTSKWAPKIFADGEEGWKMYLAAIAKDTRAVLLDMELPSWAKTIIDAVGETADMDALSAAVQQIGQIQALFESLGDTLVGFADMTDLAFEALLRASGGAEALAANTTSFYQNFYSDDERKAIAKRQLGAQLSDLGVEIDLEDPDAQAKYRKLVEEKLAQANTEEAARKAMHDALSGSLADSMSKDGGLAGLDIASLVRGAIGDSGLSAEDAQALEAGLTSLAGSGKGIDELNGSITELLKPILGTGKTSAETAAALLALNSAFKEVTISSEDAAAAEKARKDAEDKAAREAQDAAWALLQRSVDADRTAAQARVDAAQERVDASRAIIDALSGPIRELRGNVESTASITAAAANKTIDEAVGTYLRSGYMLDASALGEAAQAATAGITTDRYSSRLDYEAANMILANKLEVLHDGAEKQLSTDELALEQAKAAVDYLDRLLKQGREALDVARGIDTRILTADQAWEEFRKVVMGDKAGTSSGTGSAGATNKPTPVFGGGSSTGPAIESKYNTPVSLGLAGGVAYMPVTDSERVARLDSLYAGYHAFDGTGDAEGLNRWIAENQVTSQDLSGLSGLYERDWAAWLDSYNVPRFAAGGGHLGGLRLVGEDGPELEVTGPSRIYNASQTQQLLAGLQGSGSAEVVRLLQELITQNYAIGRRQVELLQTMESLARKSDAIGVKQRTEEATA